MARTLSLVLNKLLPLLLLVIHTTAYAEDGSQLWLRYNSVNKASVSGVEGKAAQVLRQYYSGGKVTLLMNPQQENEEGFRITMSDKGVIIASSTERGLLYGAFALLRGETGYQKPFFKYRILNHWDNLDGSIERGYAGKSIFWNDHLTFDSHRLEDYAKANAS
ncbi:MAG: alpha-glucuronidase, partial [Prevotella sp.]|nr:alpha-glucuronidase [Prevotella sp.]